jgi:hypothetical protein
MSTLPRIPPKSVTELLRAFRAEPTDKEKPAEGPLELLNLLGVDVMLSDVVCLVAEARVSAAVSARSPDTNHRHRCVGSGDSAKQHIFNCQTFIQELHRHAPWNLTSAFLRLKSRPSSTHSSSKRVESEREEKGQ